MIKNTYTNVNQIVADSCVKFGKLPALTAYANKTWSTLTYSELGGRVAALSIGFHEIGIEHGDRVAILSENRIEWALTDFALLAVGAVTVPIYPSLPEEQVKFIVTDCGATAIVVSDSKQLKKALSLKDTCTNLKIVAVMDENLECEAVVSLTAIAARGTDAGADALAAYAARRDSVASQDLMSIIYTSGTTGSPKGAMLTHANMVCGAVSAAEFFPFHNPGEVFLSFLPLCHVFERVTHCLSIMMGSHTVYNDSIFKLMDNVSTYQPTVMQCVPRVFESIHERVLETVSKQKASKQKIFHWAVQAGASCAQDKNCGKTPSPFRQLRGLIADRLVLSKVRAKFGGRLKFFVSGGAPLHPTTFDFFQAIKIPILEGWGLTETTAAASCNPFGAARVETVGLAQFGSQVRIAEDGEILVRGGGVMRGYWNQPEATAAAIDPQGWFHTGDLGNISVDGYIRITGRKKDIIVLANGKNVAPQGIESKIKESSFISEIVLLGDKSSAISAVVVPNFDKVKLWAAANNITFTDKDMASSPEIRKLIKQEIDSRSAGLADFEKIKRFDLLNNPFTVDSGELTPTLKVKRNVVAEKFGRSQD